MCSKIDKILLLFFSLYFSWPFFLYFLFSLIPLCLDLFSQLLITLIFFSLSFPYLIFLAIFSISDYLFLSPTLPPKLSVKTSKKLFLTKTAFLHFLSLSCNKNFLPPQLRAKKWQKTDQNIFTTLVNFASATQRYFFIFLSKQWHVTLTVLGSA